MTNTRFHHLSTADVDGGMGRLETHEETDQMARALLFRAACFAPGEAIPRVLLAQTVAGEEVEAEDIEDGLLRLGELGLVTEEEDGGLWMHRLVVAFVLDYASFSFTIRITPKNTGSFFPAIATFAAGLPFNQGATALNSAPAQSPARQSSSPLSTMPVQTRHPQAAREVSSKHAHFLPDLLAQPARQLAYG